MDVTISQLKRLRFVVSQLLHLKKIVFRQSLKGGKFSEIWKKANVVPVHKKESKNLVKNYRPISLFPVFCKFFLKD